MRISCFLFLLLAALSVADSVSGAIGPVAPSKAALDLRRFTEPHIYAAYPQKAMQMLEKRDPRMKALLAPSCTAERARAVVALRSTSEFEQLVAAVKEVRTIADLHSVVREHTLWPILIFDKELFAYVSLLISHELFNTEPQLRKKKIITLHALVARWWMPDHLVSFFENMGGSYLAHDGYATHESPWQSDYVPLTNISPFSSVESVHYSRAIASQEMFRSAWHGQSGCKAVAGKSFVVCLDDEPVVEQDCRDSAVPEREELGNAVVEAALPESQEECALVVLPERVRLQFPGENLSPSRYFCTNFDIDAVARTLFDFTQSFSLKTWDSAPAIESLHTHVIPPAHGRELVVLPHKVNRVHNSQQLVVKKRFVAKKPLLPQENILPASFWGNTFNSANLATLLARAARSVFSSHSGPSASYAGGMYALDGPLFINLPPQQPLWRRCLSSLWPSFYRKRYHFAFAGAAIGALGAAYCLSRGAFGAYAAASPYPVQSSPLELHANPSIKLTI